MFSLFTRARQIFSLFYRERQSIIPIGTESKAKLFDPNHTFILIQIRFMFRTTKFEILNEKPSIPDFFSYKIHSKFRWSNTFKSRKYSHINMLSVHWTRVLFRALFCVIFPLPRQRLTLAHTQNTRWSHARRKRENSLMSFS